MFEPLILSISKAEESGGLRPHPDRQFSVKDFKEQRTNSSRAAHARNTCSKQ